MSNPVIPKERSQAFQRWNLGALETQDDGYGDPADGAAPSAREIEQVRNSAREQGYAEGLRQGHAQARREIDQFRRLLDALVTDSGSRDQELGQLLVRFALDVAKQVIREELRIDPAHVLAVVREALQCVPHINQPITLSLNPADLAIVNRLIDTDYDASTIRVVEDPAVEQGGCKLRSRSSEVDATVATRWQRVIATLGEQ